MKKYILLFCTLFLTFILFNNINVNAKTSNNLNWTNTSTLKAKVNRNGIKAKLVTIKGHDWADNTKIVKTKYLRKGQIINLQNGGASWSWILSGKHFKNIKNRFWVIIKPSNNKWFNVIKNNTIKNY